MALSADELAQLHTLFQGADWASLSDMDRFNKLNIATQVPNTAPAPTVPKPFLVSDVLGCITTSVTKLPSVAFLPTIRDDILKQDRAACALWNELLLNGGIITQDEHNLIAAVLVATETDPAWPATAPGPSPKQTLFGDKQWQKADGWWVDFVPLEDVEAAR